MNSSKPQSDSFRPRSEQNGEKEEGKTLVEGKQVGSIDEEPQVRGCYNITFICTPTNQETV